MERKNSDAYIGTALTAVGLGFIASLFGASIMLRVLGAAMWVWVAVRFWQTNVAFVMLLGVCMYPPLALLFFVKNPPNADKQNRQ
jgi:hypothetical protein